MQAIVLYLPQDLGDIMTKRMLGPAASTMEKDIINLISLGLEMERKQRPDHIRRSKKK